MTAQAPGHGWRLGLLGLLLAVATAHAALQSVEEGLEVPPEHLQLPASESGSLTVKACASCAPLQLLATPGTRYQPDGFDSAPVSLAEMAAALSTADRRRALLYVFYDPGTRQLTRLVLDPAGRSGEAP